jgi:hypothetical protein
LPSPSSGCANLAVYRTRASSSISNAAANSSSSSSASSPSAAYDVVLAHGALGLNVQK